jgi:hypothetical protein
MCRLVGPIPDLEFDGDPSRAWVADIAGHCELRIGEPQYLEQVRRFAYDFARTGQFFLFLETALRRNQQPVLKSDETTSSTMKTFRVLCALAV